MSDIIEKQMRQEIADFIPAAFSKAVASYRKFSENTKPTGKAQEFGDHHKACKAALAHIELLLRLIERTDMEKIDDSHVLKAAISEAQSEYEKAIEFLNNK